VRPVSALHGAGRGGEGGGVFKDETVWLTQKALAELFRRQVPAINKHLKNIFESGELERGFSMFPFWKQLPRDGKILLRPVLQPRRHHRGRLSGQQLPGHAVPHLGDEDLREFIIKGFVLDDERLKQGKRLFGKDYFDELLERIREIRASERRFYQKITDIYALSADYDPDAPITREFFRHGAEQAALGDHRPDGGGDDL
jgi:hypothetical protein